MATKPLSSAAAVIKDPGSKPYPTLVFFDRMTKIERDPSILDAKSINLRGCPLESNA